MGSRQLFISLFALWASSSLSAAHAQPPSDPNEKAVSNRIAHLDGWSSKDFFTFLFGAGGWLGLGIKVLIDQKKDKREIRRAELKRWRELASQLNQPPLIEVRHFLETGETSTNLSGWELRSLPAFFEVVAMDCESGIISLDEVNTKYGDLILCCDGSDRLWKKENRDKYWPEFAKLVKRIRAFHDASKGPAAAGDTLLAHKN